MSERVFCSGVAGAVADYLWQELKIHPRKGDYRILSATSGPRVLTLALVINPRHAAKVMGLSEQLSMAAGLDRAASIRTTRGNRGGKLLLADFVIIIGDNDVISETCTDSFLHIIYSSFFSLSRELDGVAVGFVCVADRD